MATITFTGAEYQNDGRFILTPYSFKGEPQSGWEILRNNQLQMRLGPGFVPVRNRYCGVCSTDLARKYLPFPLPQITGHEVVGQLDDQWVCVEINASHLARGGQSDCVFCANGLHNHCPQRTTLGIDRLPGGFAPWLLAPTNSVIPIPPEVSPIAASLAEPLAAAFQGVEATRPRQGDRVAVLGPRRLGMLIIPALQHFRQKQNLDFEITAVARHAELLSLAKKAGADSILDLTKQQPTPQSFDIVFDTTGSPDGFQLALTLARRAVHLKSTHGREVMGMKHLSDMVVDELALLPYKADHLHHHWPSTPSPDGLYNKNIFVSDTVTEKIEQDLKPHQFAHRKSIDQAWSHIRRRETPLSGSPLPRYDLAIVSSLAEADRVIRPASATSLIKPTGAILLTLGERKGEPLEEALDRGLEIHTSRCGDFRKALTVLKEQPEIARVLEEHMITHQYPLSRINHAFEVASDSRKSIKVIIDASEDRG